MVSGTYEEMEPTFARHSAQLIQTMNKIIPENLVQFGHGMTPIEIEHQHKLLVKDGFFPKTFKTYENRVRDCYNKHGTAGKHKVHGAIHYFPLSLHEKGLIDHSRHVDCKIPKLCGAT